MPVSDRPEVPGVGLWPRTTRLRPPAPSLALEQHDVPVVRSDADRGAAAAHLPPHDVALMNVLISLR